ncbi:aminotransferase class I/II-fold pyridoxal phosphate-dependent enzyme [Pseudonocardia sp. TRM90224]|uniref:aminotransferase class I/II-fold pyridoxal phosphate-dependent enzyme n=1 Tax=Pseudonocardia sp. TRM90224 TaxID=2812678 RepID=UPI001E3D9598|nr:aminotransferase class I/II-fold pyridoxal phosphate-dependent enzyme [Pseudonocardia sp. TRM90224]
MKIPALWRCRYDAEYRYDRRPVGALHGIGPDRVIYGGTTSKTLASGTRLGWLVVPQHLVEPIAALRRVTDGATSTILQATYAQFLANGDLHRYLRRSRRAYRDRRDTLLRSLRCHLPDLEPSGIAAGLNVLVHLPPGTDEAEVVSRALAAGVRVYPLAQFRAHLTANDRPGIVLGYGTVHPTHAARGVEWTVPDLVDTRS